MRRNIVELTELLAELTAPVLRAGELIMAIHERGRFSPCEGGRLAGQRG